MITPDLEATTSDNSCLLTAERSNSVCITGGLGRALGKAVSWAFNSARDLRALESGAGRAVTFSSISSTNLLLLWPVWVYSGLNLTVLFSVGERSFGFHLTWSIGVPLVFTLMKRRILMILCLEL